MKVFFLKLFLGQNGCLEIIRLLGFLGFSGFMEFLFVVLRSKLMFINYAIVCESLIHILSIYRTLWGYGVGIDQNFTFIFVKVSTKIRKVMSPFWHVLM